MSHVLNFLQSLLEDEFSYSAINSARSALSSFIFIDNVAVGQHPLVTHFMTGVFNIRLVLPNYAETWNVDVVLHKLRLWSPNENLDLRTLTFFFFFFFFFKYFWRTHTHVLFWGH